MILDEGTKNNRYGQDSRTIKTLLELDTRREETGRKRKGVQELDHYPDGDIKLEIQQEQNRLGRSGSTV
jgi:hypothetical protein